MTASLIPAVVVAGVIASGGIPTCRAAFVPGISISSSKGTCGVGNRSGCDGSSDKNSRCANPILAKQTAAGRSGRLYMDNLPSLSDIEIKIPDVKEKLAGLSRPTPPPLPPGPSAPPPFDPTNPEALISVTKSFIATDFGIQSSQLQRYSTGPRKADADAAAASAAEETAAALPFYSSSLLSDSSFVWVSGNNFDDGRTGLLTKEEYLAAGRFFDLRRSFPDLEYRAHDFRIVFDEAGEYSGSKKSGGGAGGGGATPIEKLDRGEITVRFTTLVTGTFRGAPLRLRSTTLEPNGQVMKCPPTSISITYSTQGEDRGKIIKLVTDMVLDRQAGNTDGLSGVPAAAVTAGSPKSGGAGVPPLVALGRFFGRPGKPIDYGGGGGRLPPFPESVMIQLAKGVAASGFGLDDPNLLAEGFSYVEPLMGPMDKERYLGLFTEDYGVRDAVPDLDYGLQNFRVDPYDPYRVWVDTRATGTRTGSVGKRALPSNINSALYEAPPEAISFTFDDDGFCTRITAAAVLDPLLGNTGGLGGVYGLLYATGTPESALKTRSLNGFLSRGFKSLSSGVTGIGADGWRLSDGRLVNGLPSKADTVISLPGSLTEAADPQKSSSQTSAAPAPASPKPFFAAEADTISVPKVLAVKVAEKATAAKADVKPSPPPVIKKEPVVAETKTIPMPRKKEEKVITISTDPADPVTEALNSAFGIGTVTSPAKVAPPASSIPATERAQQLRNAAAAARAEANEAKKKAEARKKQEAAEKQAALEAKVEEQKKATAKKQAAMKQITSVATSSGQTASSLKGDDAAGKGAGMFSFFSPQPPTKSLKETEGVPDKKSSKLPSKAKKASVKRSPSPTISIFESLKLQAKGATTPPPKEAQTALPQAVPKGTAMKRSPTLSLFGRSTSSEKATATKKSSKKPLVTATKKAQQPRKSPTLNIFGVGGTVGKRSQKKSPLSKAKLPSPTKSAEAPVAKKSATVNLFKQQPAAKKSTKKSSTQSAPAAPKKSPTFSLFGGGAGAAKKQEKQPSVVTPTQQAKTLSAPKNPLGAFFAVGGAGVTKGKTTSAKSSAAPPKGVPVLKQWKQVKDNAVEGKIFRSSSFKDGSTVTTSSIIGKKGGFTSGNVVQTKTGSKYFLE